MKIDWLEKKQNKGIYKGGFERPIHLHLLGIKNVLKKGVQYKPTEGLCYIENTLRFKLLGQSNESQNIKVCDIQNSNYIIETISDWLKSLKKNDINKEFADEVKSNTMRVHFRGKTSLMERFNRQIDELKDLSERGVR